jgi:hypothetical protein
MSLKWWSFTKGIQLKSQATDPTDVVEGASWVNSALNKLRIYLGGASRSVVTEDQTQELTNKTIGLTNTITQIDNHEDGGANKHDASEIDVEIAGNYTTIDNLENNLGDLDAQLKSKSDQIEGHLDGSANKHDASEIDVEVAGNYTTVADLATNLTALDTQLKENTDDISDISGDFTTHTGDTSIHFTEASIDHTAILNIGTNTHSQIDDFIASKGQVDGLASLDSTGKVPANQLPSFVDDVLEYADLASFPVTGESSKIYVALDTGKTYRWSGSAYTEISPSEVNSVFGRTGIISAQASDYDADQIDYDNTTSGLAATDVQDAIDELASKNTALIEITQTSHGFAVGNGIYHNGSSWAKGQADDSDTLAYYVVVSVSDVDTFTAAQFGRFEIPSHGFTVGEYYFLSNTTAGLAVSSEPTSGYSNPLFYVENNSVLQVMVYRPTAVGNESNLGDLADVDVLAASNGQVLTYNSVSGNWEAEDVATTFEGLTDTPNDYTGNAGKGIKVKDAEDGLEFVEFAEVSSSGINYNTNNFNQNIDGVSVVNGNITVSQETGSEVLLGAGSLKIVKDAANASASYVILKEFTIAKAHEYSSFEVKFALNESTDTYVDDDLRVALYNVTQSKEIRASQEFIKANGLVQHCSFGPFQMGSSSDTYQVRLIPTNSNTNGYTLYLDGYDNGAWYVGPAKEAARGAIGSGSEIAFLAYRSAAWTHAVSGAYEKVYFDTVETNKSVGYDTTTGLFTAPETGDYFFKSGVALSSIASGKNLSIRFVKNSTTNYHSNYIGTGLTTAYMMMTSGLIPLLKGETVHVEVYQNDANNETGSVGLTNTNFSGYKLSSSVLSSESSGREIHAFGTGTSVTLTTTAQQLPLSTPIEDKLGMVSSNQITIPETGVYSLNLTFELGADASAVRRATFQYRVNGAAQINIYSPTSIQFSNYATHSIERTFTKGDVISLWGSIGSSTLSGQLYQFSIYKLSSSSPTIAQDSKVYVKAHRNGVTQTGINTNNSSVQILMNSVGGTLGKDTHGRFNTTSGYFEANETREYHVDAKILMTGSNVVTGQAGLFLYKGATFAGATLVSAGPRVITSSGTLIGLSISDNIYLLNGERLWLAIFSSGNNSVNTLTMDGSEVNSIFEIYSL